MKSNNRTLPVIVFFHLQHGWENKWNKYVEGVTEGCLDASSILAISTILKTTGATVVFCFRIKCFGENWWTKQVCPQQAIFSVQAQKITCTRVLSRVHAVIFAISTNAKNRLSKACFLFYTALLLARIDEQNKFCSRQAIFLVQAQKITRTRVFREFTL